MANKSIDPTPKLSRWHFSFLSIVSPRIERNQRTKLVKFSVDTLRPRAHKRGEQEGSSLGSRTRDVVRYRDPPQGGITSSLRIFPTPLSRSFLLSAYIYARSPSPSRAVDNAYVLPCCRSLHGAVVISPGGLYVPYHATSIAPACSFPCVVLAPSPAYPRRFPFSTRGLYRYEKYSRHTIIFIERIYMIETRIKLDIPCRYICNDNRTSSIRR